MEGTWDEWRENEGHGICSFQKSSMTLGVTERFSWMIWISCSWFS
ncbi:hypothetical protein C2W58_01690 [Bacillus pumilus]|uniref:Uncharacterized protein n=1 Tax=Bacillus pumilus TaxID=1408 RepID=A0AB34QW21_BACPU|nr:hypothetical protein B4127_3813 [Bacillus pumilus]RAP16038.1 hypothetical protein C2W58_01690 [Bacillus pumilus]